MGDYATRYVDQYGKGSFETVLVRIRREKVLSFLERYQPRRILEVGCGLEPLFPHYKRFDAWRVVEPVPDFAARSRELAAHDTRVDIFEGRLEDLAGRLAGASFDFIVVSSLLHEVSEPARLLEAIHALCDGTTVAHFNVPNVRSFHRLLALEMGLISDVFEESAMERAFGRHTRFDAERLANVLTVAGFRLLESGTYFIKPFSHAQMDTILASGMFPPSLIDGLERMIAYLPAHGCEVYANVTPG